MSRLALRTGLGLLVVLVCAACELDRAGPTPSPPADTVMVTITPTGTLTIVAGTVVTATEGTAQPARLVTRDTLNIRNGPGLNFDVVGAFAVGAEAIILGRSEDWLWWQVVCPGGVAAESCWVIAEARFSEAVDAIGVPIALAPPTPTITPTPSPTPCVPSAPAGWAPHRVQPGDTLFGLAQQSGATAEQLAAINCLETDLLTVGAVLLLPTAAFVPDPAAPLPTRPVLPAGGVAVGGGIGDRPESEGTDEREPIRPDVPAPIEPQHIGIRASLDSAELGILAVLASSQPGGTSLVCLPDDDRAIRVDPLHGWSELEIVQPFRVCPPSFDSATQVTITITGPPEAAFFSWYGGDEVKGWFWSLLPGSPLGVYTVTAQSGEVIAPATQITITRATTPTLVVLSRVVAPGEPVRVAVAAIPPGEPLYLYYFSDDEGRCKSFSKVVLPALGLYGEGFIEFPLFPTDPIAEFYCVGTGVNSGHASTSVIGPTDYKVFERLTE